MHRNLGKASAASLLAGLCLAAGCERGNQYVPPPPPEVSVTLPERRSVTIYLEYTGNTRALESVDLRARVKGFLKEVHFEAGANVKAGQLLLVIDEEPFRVAVEQAQAKLDAAESALTKAEKSKAREVSEAQVNLDQAQLLLAQIEETRQRILAGRNVASKQDLDQVEANRKKFAAQVEADKANAEQAKSDYDVNILTARANVAQAKADHRNAEISLGYCRIASPIDGRISRKLADVGSYVGDGQATVLATVLKDDPIYAYMTVSESDLLRFRKQVREGKRVDYLNDVVPLDLALSDEGGFPHHGRVDYADPGVDPTTGTVTARGIFPNPDGAIIPGLFVRIRCALEQRTDALLVPERALGADQGGSFLLVVGKDGVVEQRPVKAGSQMAALRVIDEGLKPTDRVIVNGLQRARPGQKVNAKPVEPPGAGAPAVAAAGP